MNILEKIKQFLFKSKQKALPEGNNATENNRNNFLKTLKYKDDSNIQNSVKNKYLENCISQLFEQIEQMSQESYIKSDSPIFYDALVRINAIGGSTFSNTENEEELLDFVINSDNYEVLSQKAGKNNTPIFYHMRDTNYFSPDNKDIIRLYINCKNENVAKLSHYLLHYNTEPQFYLKTCSTEYLAANKRSEKIVIYSTNSQIQSHLQLIEKIKQIKPELFEGSDKTNPFMQSSKGIAYAKQPFSNNYQLLDGSTIEIPLSANSFISQTIQESYMETLRELAHSDTELEFLLSPEIINDEAIYAGTYKYVNTHYHAHLINSMEEKMRILCTLNNVEIKGITPSRSLFNEKLDYTK